MFRALLAVMLVVLVAPFAVAEEPPKPPPLDCIAYVMTKHDGDPTVTIEAVRSMCLAPGDDLDWSTVSIKDGADLIIVLGVRPAPSAAGN